MTEANKEESIKTKNKKAKGLYRDPINGKIFGVCAGLAEYLDIDVTLIRIVFVILLFATSGIMVFVYLIFALVMPKKGVRKDETFDQKIEDLKDDINRDTKTTDQIRNYVGFGLLLVGLWLLLVQFFPFIFNFRWEYVWPILLILAGILLIARRK